jgi:hypothetical protein
MVTGEAKFSVLYPLNLHWTELWFLDFCCVLKYKQDGVLDKKRTMDNVQKHNICILYTIQIFAFSAA